MPIDTPCQQYLDAKPDWDRMRDVMGGQRRMRDVAANYLRRPSGLTDNNDWAQYVLSTPFFEATLRTMEGLSGLAFYRDPQFDLPDGMAPFVADATQDGVALQQFTERVLEEVITVNRAIVVVDFPENDPSIVTLRDAEKAQRRPYLRRYDAEELFNWTETKVRGVMTLTEARVYEIETEKVGDWDSRWRRRIRVFELVGSDATGWTYRQRVFVNDNWQGVTQDVTGTSSGGADSTPVSTLPGGTEPGGDWTEQPQIVPLIDGKPLEYMPVWVINSTDQSPCVKRPPLLPLANMNIAHFNTSAALENALFWCGNPTPYITGVDPTTTTDILVGSSKALLLGDAQSKVDFLSYGADNLAPLEKRLDRLEQHMAVLGARNLVADPKGVEAAETARIHRQGEVSVLAGICGSVSRVMTDVCVSATEWQQLDTASILVKIFTSFYDAVISSVDALNFMKLWQAGLLAPSDILALFKKGEIVPGDRSLDDIVAENQTSPIQPQVMAGLTGTSTGNIIGQPDPPPAGQE